MNNRVSRFADEIPESCIERLGQEPHRAFAGGQSHVAPQTLGFPLRFRQGPLITPRKTREKDHYGMTSGAAKPKPNTIAISVGDEVMHKGFGKGSVLSVQQMGGDALLEIQFEQGKSDSWPKPRCNKWSCYSKRYSSS